jgi:hypothetical protein
MLASIQATLSNLFLFITFPFFIFIYSQQCPLGIPLQLQLLQPHPHDFFPSQLLQRHLHLSLQDVELHADLP